MKAGIKYLRKLGKCRRYPKRKIVFELQPNLETLQEYEEDNISLVHFQNNSDHLKLSQEEMEYYESAREYREFDDKKFKAF